MKPIVRNTLAAQLAWFCHATMAQSLELVYAPAAVTSTVPTLSEWGVLGLAGLLAIATILAFRKTGSKTLLTIGLAVAAALGSGQTAHLIGPVQAGPAPIAQMGLDNGGTLDLASFWFGDEIPVHGHTSIAMQVISMTPASISTVNTPTCTAGLIVPANGVCWVNFLD